VALDTLLRIGELSRRSGVSPELLRAWERRYGLLRPRRSAGGLRLYSADDLERVRLMQRHLADGLAAAEAAALAARHDAAPDEPSAVLSPEAVRAELRAATAQFDEQGVQAVLDRVAAAASLDVLLSEVLLPFLQELGEGWERGEVTIAQEHFASSVVRGRLLGLARGWGQGLGPVALLACLPGEHHDLGLLAFGLALRARGWRIAYLGADTPVETVGQAADELRPRLVVLAATDGGRWRPVAGAVQALAGRHQVALGGAGAAQAADAGLSQVALPGDAVAEAEHVTSLLAAAG
jgi:MerR family transcriptional regulator, light-induced transcriptional regulator